MKKVLSTGITSTSQQPFTKTTHEWYNSMITESTEAIVKSLISPGAYTGRLVILSGCELTGSNPGARTISAGWVWYNGEVYKVDAKTFTTTGSQVGVWSIVTTETTLLFSDTVAKPVHQEKKFTISNGASGSGLFDEGSVNIYNLTKKHIVVAYSNASFTSTSGVNIIPVNLEDIDTDNEFDTATGRFVASEPGYYKIDCVASVNLPAGTASNVSINLGIRKNASILNDFAGLYLTNNTKFYSLSASTIVYLNGTTDYVDFVMIQDVTATCNANIRLNISLVSRA